MVGCKRDLAAAKEARLTTKVTYYSGCDPTTNLPLGVIKIFLPVFLRDVERFGVNDMAKVLVQVLRDMVQVHLSKSLTQFADEFDLWGIGVGHWDEAIGGEVLCGSGGKPDPRVIYRTSKPILADLNHQVSRGTT